MIQNEFDFEKSLKNIIINKSDNENKIVIYSNIDNSLYEIKIDEFIKQPTDGILYDLNLLPEVIFSQLKDDREWVNKYAIMSVIKKLKNIIKDYEIESMERNEWEDVFN